MVQISEASRLTGVAVDTLRFWEDEGLLDDVPRDGAGRRDYGEDDLGWVRFVQRMRATGALLDETIADYETAEAGIADDRRFPPLDNVGRLR